jgi:hypothetical protein
MAQNRVSMLSFASILAEPECVADPDCPLVEYCEPTNQTCGDPCLRWPCGPYEYGVPVNHRCPCRCIDGYEIRNPADGCGKYKRILNGWDYPIFRGFYH